MHKLRRNLTIVLVCVIFLAGPVIILFSGKVDLTTNWRNASRASVHIAPKPNQFKQAIVQIYAARAYGARGVFALHTWIALKPTNAKHYTVYQGLGWNLFYRNKSVVDVKEDIPDREWFGHKPEILFSAYGKDAQKIIPEIKKAIVKYPYKFQYLAWPGPNSNTFTAFVIRHVKDLKVRLPVTAIGKDYYVNSFCVRAPSKTGFQCVLRGILGVTLAKKEGLELNVAGFSFAINFVAPYLHFPGVD